jgi:hypothetical protein
MAVNISKTFLQQLSINPKFALKVYEAILDQGLSACEDESTFIEAVRLVVSILLKFDDYILSNNLLQVAKSEVKGIETLPWYMYASLVIMTKRIPRYIINNPKWWMGKIDYLKRVPELQSPLEAYQLMTLGFVGDILTYFDQNDRMYIRQFTQTLLNKKEIFSESVLREIEALKNIALPRAISSEVSVEVKEEIPTEASVTPSIMKIKDQKSMVLILGDLAMRKNDVYGIAKDYGVTQQQLEFVEYADIAQYKFDRLYYSTKYAGIILGPVPHKAGDLGGHSSLATKLKEEGFPHVYVSMQTGELKLSKNLLKKGFLDVISHYNSQH